MISFYNFFDSHRQKIVISLVKDYESIGS